MTQKTDADRRRFLASAAAASATSLLRVGAPALAVISQAACSARDEGQAFTVLGKEEALDFTAIAARIIPTTETPGANEAGVIYFFDRAFGAEIQNTLPFARDGLAALNDSLGRRFASLGEPEQDRALTGIEDGAFFEFMRAMTIFGFFALQEHGGNKDDVGWKLVGFEGHRGAWQYPFGYYDAEVHGGARDDE
jgi:gluconate 2-dehydrogenase gamma chain